MTGAVAALPPAPGTTLPGRAAAAPVPDTPARRHLSAE
jgi:hypothetical protein